MQQTQDKMPPVITYFFTRSKDIHIVDGNFFVTLFVRLTRVFTKTVDSELYEKTESVWVAIEELEIEQATEKILALPNRINVYTVSEEIFLELYKMALNCPKELYYITPLTSCKKK